MPKYEVIAPLLHEGVIVAEGYIDLHESQVDRLTGLGVIGEAVQEPDNDDLDNDLDKDPDVGLNDMTIAELRSYAAEHEIDLGEHTKKADILGEILKAGGFDVKPDEQAGA